MHAPVLVVAIVWLGVLLAVVGWQVVRAPTPLGRVLALDTLAVLLIAALGLIGHTSQLTVFLDAALGIALLAFVGTLAATHYLQDGRVF